jgi:hypothetical protein
MENNYSLADIRAATRDDDRGYYGCNDLFGGGGLTTIIVIFFLFAMMGGGFGGFGGFGGWGGFNGAAANGALTRAELQAGFDTQEITRKLDGITNGLSDGFYAQNTTMLNGFAGVTAAVNDARFATQSCCCETNRNIDSVKYENAQNTCAITTAIHAEGEETRRMLAAQENAWLRDQLEQARNANSNYMQSQYLLGQIGRWYSNPPCDPCAGYGYGYNRGGGCGGCCNNI